MEQVERKATTKIKKPLKIIGILFITIIVIILLGLFAKQCYLVYIMGPGYSDNVPFENVPKWLIYGGQERYDELYRMGTDHIREHLEKKYSESTKITIDETHVMVDMYEITEPIEYRSESFFDERWLQYNGVVMAKCTIDGKQCANISGIYNTDTKLPIDEKFIRAIGKDSVAIYRIADKEIAQKFADDEVEIYDIWEDVDECYISRGKQSQYGFGWIWEYRDYVWTPKSDANAESSIGQH